MCAFLQDFIVVRRSNGPSAGDDDGGFGQVHAVGSLLVHRNHFDQPRILHGGGKRRHGGIHRCFHRLDGVGAHGAKHHGAGHPDGGKRLTRKMGFGDRVGFQVNRQAVRCQGHVHERRQPGEKIPALGAGQAQQGVQTVFFNGSGQSARLEVGTGCQVGTVHGNLYDFLGTVFAQGFLGALRRTVHHQSDDRVVALTAGGGEYTEIGVFHIAVFGFNQNTDGSHIIILLIRQSGVRL